MTGPDYAMVTGDLIAIASLVSSWVISRNTKRRLDASKWCPSCYGPVAGYVHEPGCTGVVGRR